MALKIHLANTLPIVLEPNSIYLVKGDTEADVEMYVVGQTGTSVRKSITREDLMNVLNSGGLVWTTVNETIVNAVSGHVYRLANANASTLILAANPADGDVVGLKCSNGRVDNVIDPNGKTIEGTTGPMTIDQKYVYLVLRYSAVSGTWEFISAPVSSVTPYVSGGDVFLNEEQTLTKKTMTSVKLFNGITEDVFSITDGANVDLDPVNGAIQQWTLGASRTATANNFQSGQSMVLGIKASTGLLLTLPAINWVKAGGGGTPPSLHTTLTTWIELWKVGNVLNGSYLGDS